jgi:hypothetical protein
MIGNDLRRTFAAHERLTPDVDAVAARIALGIVRRRRRVLAARLTAVAAVVLVLGVFIPVMLSQLGARPIQPGVPTPSPLPSISTGPASGLVPAPPTELVIPMSPGWLPDEVRTPTYTYTDANLTEGSRTLTYEARPEVSGVESVSVMTRTQAPEAIGGSPTNEGYPPWVSTHDERTIEVRGRQARETVTTSVSVGARSCVISWTEPSGLMVTTTVMEKTTSTQTTCAIGERFARELKAMPFGLARTVSLGLVPMGYQLVRTGTNQETWCPGARVSVACIEIQDGQNCDAPEDSTPIAVRGHQGYLSRNPNGVLLLVPGFVRLSLQSGVHRSTRRTRA